MPDMQAGLDNLDRGLDLLDNGHSIAEAVEAFRSAARQGVAEGYMQLARLERQGGNEGAALDLIGQVEDMAARGDAMANLSLSIFHDWAEGEGSPQEQEHKSLHYLRRSSELGNPMAQLMLAQALRRGYAGAGPDAEGYELWIARAIEHGLAEAVLTHSRHCLELGRDIEPALMARLKALAPPYSEEAAELLQRIGSDWNELTKRD
jgi:TPR repeat protein